MTSEIIPSFYGGKYFAALLAPGFDRTAAAAAVSREVAKIKASPLSDVKKGERLAYVRKMIADHVGRGDPLVALARDAALTRAKNAHYQQNVAAVKSKSAVRIPEGYGASTISMRLEKIAAGAGPPTTNRDRQKIIRYLVIAACMRRGEFMRLRVFEKPGEAGIWECTGYLKDGDGDTDEESPSHEPRPFLALVSPTVFKKCMALAKMWIAVNGMDTDYPVLTPNDEHLRFKHEMGFTYHEFRATGAAMIVDKYKKGKNAASLIFIRQLALRHKIQVGASAAYVRASNNASVSPIAAAASSIVKKAGKTLENAGKPGRPAATAAAAAAAAAPAVKRPRGRPRKPIDPAEAAIIAELGPRAVGRQTTERLKLEAAIRARFSGK